MEPILKTITTLDWITITLFSSLIFVITAKTVFYGRFLNFMILPFNNKYIFLYCKKEKIFNWFTIFLSLFQLINYSLFIFFIWKIFRQPNPSVYLIGYVSILGFLFLFSLLKIFLQLSNAFVFSNYKFFSEILFKKLSYLNYSAFIVFIANVLLSYVLIDSKWVLPIALIFTIIINGMGWLTILKNHQKFIAYNLFYFILYLCTLEIAPLVIIGNLLK